LEPFGVTGRQYFADIIDLSSTTVA